MIRPCTRLPMSSFFVVLVCAALLIPIQSSSKDLETRHLFKIERSKNANIVQYDVQLTPDGKLYPKNPVIVYWIRLAKDGRRKELTFIQRHLAYGFKAEYEAGGNCVTMDMVAKIGRKIKVYEVDGVYRGEMEIDGNPAFIEKIYVTCVEGGIIPKVKFIELYGKDVETGNDRYEKINPK